MLPLFAIMHPLVDACSVGVLVAGGMTLERVMAYNAMAFALQLPFGLIMDSNPGLNKRAFFVGVGLTFFAAVSVAFGFGGWWFLAVACVGNALFHLTAGKNILEAQDGRSGPIGLFISTGALGLMAGQAWVAKAATICLATFAAALAVTIVLAAVSRWNEVEGRTAPSGAAEAPLLIPALVLGGLFVLIVWRSWAGLFAGSRSAGGTLVMMFAGAAATFAGKVAGGYIAERLGRWKVTFVSVAGSAALAFLCEPSWAVAWLVLLFVAQLATGPVLSLVYEKSERCGGTAFGLNCLALFMGSLS